MPTPEKTRIFAKDLLRFRQETGSSTAVIIRSHREPQQGLHLRGFTIEGIAKLSFRFPIIEAGQPAKTFQDRILTDHLRTEKGTIEKHFVHGHWSLSPPDLSGQRGETLQSRGPGG